MFPKTSQDAQNNGSKRDPRNFRSDAINDSIKSKENSVEEKKNKDNDNS